MTGVVAIMQARMSSSRLPGKVLKPLLGRPMILRQIERVARCRRIDRLVVATSVEATDDVLERTCVGAGVEVFRGSLEDVLDRYHAAALDDGPPAQVVRLTADCPLADWTVIDACVARQIELGADYTSNVVERTFPKGLDVEAFTFEALERAWRDARDAYEREHVTPYLYRHPELFRLETLVQDEDRSAWRWTVDTPADFAMVEKVYGALYASDPAFGTRAIQRFLAARPDVAALNGALG